MVIKPLLTVSAPCYSLFDRVALDKIGLKRYCCRRMMLTHVDLITKLLNYNSKSREKFKRVHCRVIRLKKK